MSDMENNAMGPVRPADDEARAVSNKRSTGKSYNC